jgi:glycosyltransferase involved in cell wall biosynthesis
VTTRLSIVIPCFNQAHFLGHAIASARNQRGFRAEIIVVDDGSTDETSRVADAHAGIRIVRQKNLGAAVARNTGLAVARGEFIIFLDADDMLLPDAAAIGCGLLEGRRDAPIACGRCRLVDHHGRELMTGAPQPIRGNAYIELLSSNFIWTPGAAVFRRTDVIAAGGFATAYPATADYRLYLALARSHAVVDHPHDVVLYRQHESNMSNDPVLMLRETLAALEAERPHVPPEYRSAFRRGRRAWQDYYGDRIANDIRMLVRRRAGAAAALRMAAALVRYHPSGFARHVLRKTATTLGVRQAEQDPPPKSPHPADAIQQATAVGERMAPSRPGR